jgi:hypothetical protein
MNHCVMNRISLELLLPFGRNHARRQRRDRAIGDRIRTLKREDPGRGAIRASRLSNANIRYVSRPPAPVFFIKSPNGPSAQEQPR